MSEGRDLSPARRSKNMKGVHSQVSAAIMARNAINGFDSHVTGSTFNIHKMLLIIPKSFLYMNSHIRPTRIGGTIMGRMRALRRTPSPLICTSLLNSNARPNPITNCRPTVEQEKMSVLSIIRQNTGSVNTFA